MNDKTSLPQVWIEFKTKVFTKAEAMAKFKQITGREPEFYYNTGYRLCLWYKGMGVNDMAYRRLSEDI